jgi:predicted PurR-regulated permease PerM
VPSQEQLLEQAGTAAKTAGAFLVSFASRMTATTAAFLLNLFVMLYAMFFFFRDGDKILERIFYYTPLSDEDETRMLTQFASITRATVKGTLVIGVIQGTLAGIAFRVAGIEGAALWGTIMTILAIIPGIGAALIWVPAVVILFLTGQHITAILLATWCAAVVGTVDNFLRPVLVGRDAKMPDLLILIGTLGGLFLFGPIGFIVGPIVCGLFLTVWDIYGTTFREVLPPVTSFRPSDQTSPAIVTRESVDK